LQDVLAGGALCAPSLLALFYCGVLFTEGIGVYMQKRWAEWLMMLATGALIPLEVWHLWHRLMFHRPSLAALLILLANCFIVWFLYLVLKRDKAQAHTEPKKEFRETRYADFGSMPTPASAATVFSIGKPITLENEPSILAIIVALPPWAA